MNTKTGMQDLILDKKGIKVSSQREILSLHHDSFVKPISIPLSQIASIIITCQLELTSTLLTRLSKANISLCVIPASRAGETAFLLGDWHAGVTRRQWQYECINNTDLQQQWAMRILRLKIHQQANSLASIQQCISISDETDVISPSLDSDSLNKYIKQIKSLRDKLKPYRLPISTFRNSLDNNEIKLSTYTTYPTYSVSSLLGTEGSASNQYFACYKQFFDPCLNFQKRTRRPPTDPVNVILSLSYTLLTHLCHHALSSVGFDPYAGIIHSTAYNRPSLACDLAELQRNTIDEWVWQLFAHKKLLREDFSEVTETDLDSSTPCVLLKQGRQKYYAEFAKIRHSLLDIAIKRAWLWQKRLQTHFKNTDFNTSSASVSSSEILNVDELSQYAKNN